jgi:hypothetical protein
MVIQTNFVFPGKLITPPTVAKIAKSTNGMVIKAGLSLQMMFFAQQFSKFFKER